MVNPQTHILIVDDSTDDRDMFAHYLSRKGFRVAKARDGKEGLEMALDLRPDLVVLDLWLPRISGWEVAQRLKADDRTKRIPVLVVTGHSSARPLACDGLMMKPCPLDELEAEIFTILQACSAG